MTTPSLIKSLRITALCLAAVTLLTACTPTADVRADFVPAALELPQDATRTIAKTGNFVSREKSTNVPIPKANAE